MTWRGWTRPVLLTGSLFLVLMMLRGLEVAPVDLVPASDRTTFSAARAFDHLEYLIRENAPHPPGSAAHRVIGDRIGAKLRELGYRPEVQEGLQCSTLAPGCSVVRNIVAVRRGTTPGRAVMVTAHYDSVPGSAAASDDGVGVAVMLEIADLLGSREPSRNDIVFLFSDAEESGLRGAMMFAKEHPLMKRIGLVVNLEARGASGPSAMFETGAGNAALISLLAEAVSRPTTNSLLFEVYRHMPNNTDFTIYRDAGLTGYNFAFSRSASLYHSVRDDLAHVDRTSLQHQGQNVLAVTQAAAAVPLNALASSSDASYVDAAARGLLHWPVAWNLPLALTAMLLVVVLAVLRAPVRLRSGAWAVLALAASVVLVLALGWLLSWPLGRWPGAHPLDHPHPWPGRIALLAATVLAVWVSARWIGRHAGTAATLTATWFLLATMAVTMAIVVPGAAFALLLPVLVYVAVGISETLVVHERRRDIPLLASACALGASIWSSLYLFLLADVVLGFQLSHLKALPLLLFALPLLPLAIEYQAQGPPRAAPIVVTVVATCAAILGAIVPAHTVDRPRGVNLVHVQEPGAPAIWLVESYGEPGADVLDAMGFDGQKQPILRYGVVPRDAYVKPAPPSPAPAPVVTVDEDFERDGMRLIRGSVRSQRAAYTIMLGFAAAAPVTALRMAGQLVLDQPSAEPRVVGLHGTRSAATRFEIVARPGAPFNLVVLDIAPLPVNEETARLLATRPAVAAPLQNGDQSIVLRRIQL